MDIRQLNLHIDIVMYPSTINFTHILQGNRQYVALYSPVKELDDLHTAQGQ